MADLGVWVRDVLRVQATVDWFPRLAAVVGAEAARRRDCDEDPLRVARCQQNRVQAHPAGARLPFRPRAVTPQPGELAPCGAAVARSKQRGVFHPGVDRVRIGERRLEMPDSLELRGVLRAVVPLVCGEGFTRTRRRVVDELVALAGRHAAWRHGHPAAGRFPRLAAVARALDDLSEPPARLRRVKAIWIGGGSLQVIDLPPREVGAAHVPSPALPVRCQDERALTCANQYPYAAHASVPS